MRTIYIIIAIGSLSLLYVQYLALEQQKLAREAVYCMAGDVSEIRKLQAEESELREDLYKR